jgi:hypothetical protein
MDQDLALWVIIKEVSGFLAAVSEGVEELFHAFRLKGS